MISQVLLKYWPDWTPPPDRGSWNTGICPAHGDTRPSFRVSYTHDACRCMACGFGGSAAGIIADREGVTIAEAHRIAERIFMESGGAVPEKPSGKSRRVDARRARLAQRRRAVRPWLRS